MTIDAYTPTGREPRTKYDFTGAKPGMSMWFATPSERMSAYKSFTKWAAKNATGMSAHTVKVGSKDPRGAGYRLVFERASVDLKPAIVTAVEVFDLSRRDACVAWVFEYTGITSNDDIVAAAKDEANPPQTLAEAKAFVTRLLLGETARQLEFCAAQGKSSAGEARERAAHSTGRAPTFEPPPPPIREAPTMPWASIPEDTKREMRRHGVGNWDEFRAAFMAFPPSVPVSDVIESIAGGYSPATSWKIRTGQLLPSED